ncbi:GNAT family protein [Rugosimonospora acidiphila]|uniref:GNAT family protein n=1 Tax=Rugosimonospora acidiphila TaxID=556531 RepID=A0ABP9SST7_9ACTN
MEFVTSRLVLRDFSASDRDAVHGYASDPEVTRFMDWGPNSPRDTVAFLAEAHDEASATPRSNYTLAVVVRANDELIGAVHLGETSGEHRRGELGYVLARSHWRKGYATEAAAAVLDFGFREVGFHKVTATCDPDNTRSARVLKKIGMRYEGRLRQHLLIRGQWRDRLAFAALSTESLTGPES